MLLTAPTDPIVIAAAPTGGATPPATPSLDELAGTFTDIASKLSASDETIAKMVTDRSPVGTGWAPHLSALAGRLQVARDAFLAAGPDTAGDLGAKLGADVLKLAEASGSMSIMARQRATLSEGWASFLDTAIENATAAAALLKPADPDTKPGDGTPPADEPGTEPGSGTTPPALDPKLAGDVSSAFAFVQQSIEKIRTVPPTDTGDASTRDARIAAHKLNMQAQGLLEQHFGAQDAALASTLRSADASLEDANWQLAKKPSPDGRFTGVDIPGALRDSQAAADALVKLVNPDAIEVDPAAA